MRALTAILIASIPCAMAQAPRASTAPPSLAGVYQIIAGATTLFGGLKNAGSPAELVLLPAAAQQMKSVNIRQDPAKMCAPVGPFRMMAREENKIELVPARGMIVMLFEDLSHGVMRTIYLNRGHPENFEPNWMGDSVGRWDGNLCEALHLHALLRKAKNRNSAGCVRGRGMKRPMHHGSMLMTLRRACARRHYHYRTAQDASRPVL